MKKTLLICILGISAGLYSCKKSYSCECTSTITFNGLPPYTSTSTEPISQKATMKQAKSICAATEAQLTEHLQQQLADPKVSSVSSAECTVK